ncbi:hypothetical protein BH20ACI3_BH20ACI3_42660 [soil metagenome]
MTWNSPLTRCSLTSSHCAALLLTRQSLLLCLKLLFSGNENCFVRQRESPALIPAAPSPLKPAAVK